MVDGFSSVSPPPPPVLIAPSTEYCVPNPGEHPAFSLPAPDNIMALVRRGALHEFSFLQNNTIRKTLFCSIFVMATGTFTHTQDSEWQLKDEDHCRIEAVDGSVTALEQRVVTLSPASKSQLFSPNVPQSQPLGSKPEDVLKLVKNSGIAMNFGLKSTTISNTPFRLLHCFEPGIEEENIISDLSFIALSYCWRDGKWDRLADTNLTACSKAPISESLFQALLTERSSSDEGIWIDQLCINQTDENEKMQAIGSMDVIYRSARLVVVALEDILVDEDEEAALCILMEKYKRKDIWLPEADIHLIHQLTKLMWRIFSARWFTRAWCGHELQVSRNQLFLIRVGGENRPCRKVVKITAAFLNDLCHVEARLDSIKPTDVFKTFKILYNHRRSHFVRYMLLILPRMSQWVDDSSEDDARVRNYMRVFAEVFSYNSSVIADKLAILLNVLRCGLYLGTRPETEHECCYIFYHLALASRDPTTLTIHGERLINRAVWMRRPRSRDIYETFLRGTRHLRLKEIPQFITEELLLDMVFLGSSRTLQRASNRSRLKAENIVEVCIDLFGHTSNASWLFDGAEDDLSDFRSRRNHGIDILACALECGEKWTAESLRLKDDDEADQLYPALDYIEHVDCKEWRLHSESADHFHALLEFLDALVGLWLVNTSAKHGSPGWLQTGPGPANMSLILCPPNIEFQIAIPALLLRPEYNFLQRIWFVVPEDPGAGDSGRWVVIGKATSFGTADFELLAGSEMLRQEQRICG
ncbi:MAG: hypothetical protein Q9187_002812 [Circinaria calcarea]